MNNQTLDPHLKKMQLIC